MPTVKNDSLFHKVFENECYLKQTYSIRITETDGPQIFPNI